MMIDLREIGKYFKLWRKRREILTTFSNIILTRFSNSSGNLWQQNHGTNGTINSSDSSSSNSIRVSSKRFGGLFKSRFEHKPNETLAHQARNLSTGRVALYGWTNGNVESGSNNSGWKGGKTNGSLH